MIEWRTGEVFESKQDERSKGESAERLWGKDRREFRGTVRQLI